MVDGGEGDGEGVACAPSLEEEDVDTPESRDLSFSASGESAAPVCVFAEDAALDFCLFAVRDVD